jgi:hypothetical protein
VDCLEDILFHIFNVEVEKDLIKAYNGLQAFQYFASNDIALDG